MKTFWKALGIAALAAVVPVRYKKDEETGARTFQSLLWKLDISSKEGDDVEIGLGLMDGVLTAPLMDAIAARQEAELFADDEPKAALIEMDKTVPETMIAGAEMDKAAPETMVAEAETDETAPDAAETIETEV